MPSRKRKRTELSPAPIDSTQVTSQVAHSSDKEEDVWEAFRDEHVEAIDQVPLTLHRQYALVHELDQQVNAHTEFLLSILLKYIRKRRELGLARAPSATTDYMPEAKVEHSKSSHPSTSPTPELNTRRSSSQRVSTPALPSHFMKSPVTTRQILSHIARVMQDLVRASEDKVNVAQAANDSVNRHIRILRQAIRDQEASITLGARPGHLEPENLSELTVGRWVKPSRTTLSPINGESFEEPHDARESTSGDTFLDRGNFPMKKHRILQKAAGQFDNDQTQTSTALTITLPAQLSNPIPDVSEETYCYCQQGSFGEMIACDNKKCPREWYHVGCVGLATTPEGMKTWYCPDCRPSRRGYKRK